MVTTQGGYYNDEETSYRRFSTRSHGNSLGYERDLPPAPLPVAYDSSRRSIHSAPHDSRSSERSVEHDPNTRTRSRIPLACGRCRKRKIRCSGDNGGGPCTSCKNAGNEHCRFLRVSSTGLQMKVDGSSGSNSGSDFGYDQTIAAPRVQCRIATQGTTYTSPHSSPVDYDSYPFRGHNMSAYHYSKPYYPAGVPAFPDFADDTVEYGLHGASYQLLSSDPLGIPINSNFGSAGSNRGWNPATQLPKAAPFFMDQDTAFKPDVVYNQGQPSYHGGSFPTRSPLTPEAKGLSLTAIPSLPAPVAGNDRLLPYPSANRQPAQVGAFHRAVDSMSNNVQSGCHSYNNLMTSNMLSGSKAMTFNPVSDNSSYLPVSSNSPESLASPLINYSGSDHSISLSHHQSDIYGTNEGLYSGSDPSDSSYGTSSGESKRGSHSSHATSIGGSIPSTTEGNLVNGHAYVPYNGKISSICPAPRMDLSPSTSNTRRPSSQTTGLVSS